MQKASMLILLYLIGGSSSLFAARPTRAQMRKNFAKREKMRARKNASQAYQAEERSYGELKDLQAMFAPTMEIFFKLKACKPKEYAYYNAELKKIIYHELATEKFEKLFSFWGIFVFGNGKTEITGYNPHTGSPIYEKVKPIKRFRETIIPTAAASVRKKMLCFTNINYRDEAQALLDNLESLKSEILLYS